MRQRNDTGENQHVSAWPTEDDPGRRPFVVADGEETDFPELLAGFTALDEPKGRQKAKPERVAPSIQDAAVAAVKEEGEPQ